MTATLNHRAAPDAGPEDAAARPLLARYLFEQRIDNQAAGLALDLSREAIRKMCLPFASGARRLKPSKVTAARIETWTGGRVPAWTFDDTPEARAAFFKPLSAGREGA